MIRRCATSLLVTALAWPVLIAPVAAQPVTGVYRSRLHVYVPSI